MYMYTDSLPLLLLSPVAPATPRDRGAHISDLVDTDLDTILLSSVGYGQVASQGCFFEEKGAYTGAVAVSMVESMGCDYVLAGHSERR